MQAHANSKYISDLDYDETKDMLVSGSQDRSIAFIKLIDRRITKKYENLENAVKGIRFI